MIVFGTGVKRLDSSNLDTAKCPSCANYSLKVAIFQKYFSIFFIPVFPYKKVATVQCAQCESTLEEKNFPIDIKKGVEIKKQDVKTPIYLFIGLILLFVASSYYYYSTVQEEQKIQSYLKEPRVNDYYIMDIKNAKDPTYKYLIFKVNKVESDSIQFLIGQYLYNGKTGAKKAIHQGTVNEQGYFVKPTVIARNDIDKEGINTIIRPGPE